MIRPLLLVIPPLTQLNTPYPSTAYLAGFLRARGYAVSQADLGLDMMLALLSRSGLTRAFTAIESLQGLPGEARQMLAMKQAYLDTIEPVIAFLQGRDPALAPLICHGRWLPRGPRFATLSTEQGAASSDVAKHLATLYVEDLADLLQATIAPHLGLSRYAEQVATSATSFDPIADALAQPLSLPDELMLHALARYLDAVQPAVVGLTVPFPGNLYGALRSAQFIKRHRPHCAMVLGGGYINTELRRLSDPRVFELVDYVTLDDGERPLLCLLEYLDGQRSQQELKRTFMRVDGRVIYADGASEGDPGMAELGTPTYAGLQLDRYLTVLDSLNPMHRLWSDGHWNKLTVAHGCYWKQCTFCDVGLDYIGRYEPAPTALLVDRVDALIAETGRRGFHFVDEAAPPAALKALALALLERGVVISWWANIRFEQAFTPDLCRLLAASGCIAVSAGLEVASDRLLSLMKKGITVDQTVAVAAALRASGILVHAYLMYGFPTETVAETVESLERVRQLFAHDLIQSAFWHRFVATAHSPIGLDPHEYGIRILGPTFGGFAQNDLLHCDDAGGTAGWLGDGLRLALYNYKEGRGLSVDVRRWFQEPVRKPRVPKDWAGHVLRDPARAKASTTARAGPVERHVVWIGGVPTVEGAGRMRRLILPNRTTDTTVRLPAATAEWVLTLLDEASPRTGKKRTGYPSLARLEADYPLGGSPAFRTWQRSAAWSAMRQAGLLLV